MSLFPTPAFATTVTLHWQGDLGYQVQATVVYPDTLTTGMAAIEGIGQSHNLEALTVDIFSPDGQKLATYANVIDGRSPQNNFLQWHFDIAQQKAQGWVDIGGVSKGDYFLKGQLAIGLDLFYLDAQGIESKVDHNNGQIDVIPSPEQ